MKNEELIKNIKLCGGRITKTRKILLDFLNNKNNPVSGAEILSFFHKKKNLLVNRSTIYRELKFLTAHNFIREVKLIKAPSLYELAHDHCHHLICLNCNQVQTIKMDNHLHQEEKNIFKKEKFQVTGHSLEFYGLCKKCR